MPIASLFSFLRTIIDGREAELFGLLVTFLVVLILLVVHRKGVVPFMAERNKMEELRIKHAVIREREAAQFKEASEAIDRAASHNVELAKQNIAMLQVLTTLQSEFRETAHALSAEWEKAMNARLNGTQRRPK